MDAPAWRLGGQGKLLFHKCYLLITITANSCASTDRKQCSIVVSLIHQIVKDQHVPMAATRIAGPCADLGSSSRETSSGRAKRRASCAQTDPLVVIYKLTSPQDIANKRPLEPEGFAAVSPGSPRSGVPGVNCPKAVPRSRRDRSTLAKCPLLRPLRGRNGSCHRYPGCAATRRPGAICCDPYGINHHRRELV